MGHCKRRDRIDCIEQRGHVAARLAAVPAEHGVKRQAFQRGFDFVAAGGQQHLFGLAQKFDKNPVRAENPVQDSWAVGYFTQLAGV